MPDVIAIAIGGQIKRVKEKLSYSAKWVKGEAKKKVIINEIIKLLLECYSDKSLLAFAKKYQGSFDHMNQNNDNDLIRRVAKFLPQFVEERREEEKKKSEKHI